MSRRTRDIEVTAFLIMTALLLGCRSLQSDAECMDWMRAGSCTVFGDFPGKSCGMIIEGLHPKEPTLPPPFPPGPWPSPPR
jgi:hypothetical protein